MTRGYVKKLGFPLLLAICIVSFSGCTKYVKEDINDIIYAEPTEEAKNFDLEAHINSLPEVKYEKVDYFVKETYTYNFNNYTLTVDVPEGFEAYTIRAKKPKVIESTSFDDSCVSGGQLLDGKTCFSTPGVKMDTKIISDNILCIRDNRIEQNLWERSTRYWQKECDGITIRPWKSKYTGISLRDVFRSDAEEKHILEEQLVFGIHKKFVSNNLLSNDQSFTISSYTDSHHFSKDLYFSIIDSMKIKENEQ